MKGDRKPAVINGFLLTYEQHKDEQGSHRISAQQRQLRVLPDGHTTAKTRHKAISNALRLSDTLGDVALRLAGRYTVQQAGKTPHRDRILLLLHEGPVCGVNVQFTNRAAARILELRKAGWTINTVPCQLHRHDSQVAAYVLG